MIYINGKPVNTTVFPDNTSQVWKLDEEVFNSRNIYIKWVFSNEAEVFQIVQLAWLLSVAKQPNKKILEMTYLPYGRQDKLVFNHTTFALRPFADLINDCRFNEVHIHDPHSDAALRLIVNSKPIYPKEAVENTFLDTGSDIVCYPDRGAVSKYVDLYKLPYVYGEKERDQLTGFITSYKLEGDVKDKTVLIVDDICDGGATFTKLTGSLLLANAKAVHLFVSHGIFSKGVRILKQCGIDKVFTKDGEIFERSQTIGV